MKWYLYLSLVVSGIGVGWLTGLSVSPVVSIVITSVIGAATATIAAVSGLEVRNSENAQMNTDKGAVDKKSINPLPLAILIIGIFVGSIFGISARNQSWMGSDLSAEIQKWTNAGLNKEEVVYRLFNLEHPYTAQVGVLPVLASQLTTTPTLTSEINAWTALGLGKEEVARRLFEITYPFGSSPANNENGQSAVLGTVLYSHKITECDQLSNYLLPSVNQSLLRRQVIGTQLEGLLDIIEDPDLLRKVLEELCNPG